MTRSDPSTRWSLVQEAKRDTPEGRGALSELCALYYQPVRRYISQWSVDQTQVDDLAHSFFAKLLQGDRLRNASEDQGRFRSYLLGATKHFLLEQMAAIRAQKRGDGAQAQLLHDDLPDARQLPPDQLFDKHWALTVLDQTLITLEKEMNEQGKANLFTVLKPWLHGQADHGQTSAAAGELHTSETAVRVLLHRMKKRFRELLRHLLAQTLTAPGDVDTELQYLLQALREPSPLS
jgi:DNA-directed RNA polymerase specialized sigma24 family protein